MIRIVLMIVLITKLIAGNAQMVRIEIEDADDGTPVAGASLLYAQRHHIANEQGWLYLQLTGDSLLKVTASGYQQQLINFPHGDSIWRVKLKRLDSRLDEVVVTGTMRAVSRSKSPVPVEIYTPKFFIKNPTPALFDALQLVNGIRPQLNCNICNTGDIHINGLEGAYTTILIDGMPIVSSLASVYGLSGIPNSMVERIEVVKGPASSLYGSEAIGGLINVITKSPGKAPRLSLDFSATSWQEYSADLAVRYAIGSRVTVLTSVSLFNYSRPKDNNKDNFTDVTLQQRVSVFNKFMFRRRENRQSSLALRYIYEDRWGGEMNWKPVFRGTDSVYGEQATTSRIEMIGTYQLPVREKMLFSWSLNSHDQRSAYGTMLFNARQQTAFAQLTWDKAIGEHHLLLAGITSRYTWYDDNTAATADSVHQTSMPEKVLLPGIFLQAEVQPARAHTLLGGIRFDHDSRHGIIITPRFAWKAAISDQDILRLNAGSGFRVVNIFTEDHAALTGARSIVFAEALRPEKSINVNLNYVRNIAFTGGWINLDFSAWYTRFSNKIIPDYTSNSNQIIYANLDGYAISQGFTLNSELAVGNYLRLTLGGTLMDVSNLTGESSPQRTKHRQLLTERWTSTWALSYTHPISGWSADYTGNIYGPMLLPLLSEQDPRPGKSPVWSIQNIQLSKKLASGWSVYGGIKNLLNFTPARNIPFLLARAHDPFDKKVEFSPEGSPLITAENPYGLSFDPGYAYAPNQGIRGFIGVRWVFNPE